MGPEAKVTSLESAGSVGTCAAATRSKHPVSLDRPTPGRLRRRLAQRVPSGDLVPALSLMLSRSSRAGPATRAPSRRTAHPVASPHSGPPQPGGARVGPHLLAAVSDATGIRAHALRTQGTCLTSGESPASPQRPLHWALLPATPDTPSFSPALLSE